MKLADRIIARLTRRPPDFIIGGAERPYLRRWWVIPRNKLLNVYLHQFLRSDDDRAHHSHPWLFRISWILRNSYTEHRIVEGGISVQEIKRAGTISFSWGASPHRVELLDQHRSEPRFESGAAYLADVAEPIECWTLFITGPRVREWGFYCMERGFIHWKRFTAPDDKGLTGKGCDA